ncbi:MAG: hypothetical protein ACRDFB_06220, partial [Rhabdochlamydiaceae bacterium]
MVLKTDSNGRSLNLPHSAEAVGSLSLKQPYFFTNHQKWQISHHLDCETGSSIFHLHDTYGVSYTTSEFIVENLGPDFINTLTQLSSAQEQQQLIHQYLQERLEQATPYRVHVEHYDNKLVVRFGDYGLKGGVEEVQKGKINTPLAKIGALVFSTVQVVGGIYLSAQGGKSGKFGGVLISSGLSSGMYVYQTETDEDKKKYENKEYAKQFVYGLLTGGISGGFGWLAEGAETWAKIGWQTLGAAAGSAVSTTASEVAKKGKKADLKVIGIKTVIGGIGGGTGAATGALLNGVMDQDVAKVSADKLEAAIHVLKKALEGGASSASSKIATNLCENSQETDPKKKKDLKALTKEAFQSAVIGALISGAIAKLEQSNKIQEYNDAKKQLEQTQKELQDAKAERSKSESTLKDLQKTLQQSEQSLVEKQQTLKLQEQSLYEKKLQQQKIQQQVETDQLAINEAQKIATIAEQQLHTARQSLLEAQQQVEKNQQAINEAQKIAHTVEQQLHTAEQTAQQAQHAHAKIVTNIDEDIRRHLKDGYKAKIKDHYTKNEDKIRNAYLQGKKFEWKQGQNRVFGSRETVRMKPSHLIEKYQQAQEQVCQAQQKIQELQASIDQKHAELKAAQDQFRVHNQDVDQTQANLQAAQAVQLKQADLNVAQGQLKLYQQDIQQAHQAMQTLQEVIEILDLQAQESKTQLSAAEAKLQEVLSKETHLMTLSNEQQIAIKAAEKNFQKFYQKQVVHELLREAIKPPPPISYTKSDISELISHVVLVHAECQDNGARYYPEEFDWTQVDDKHYPSLFTLQKMLTSDGTIGQHLQLEKQEFSGGFIARPQMHWAWNQLVQPNSGAPLGGWEDATVAILEPLSTFESSRYKPFAVAPYDTQTFGPVHLSETSTILVPAAIVAKVQAHLTSFKGRVVGYDSDSKKLRTAIIDTLDTTYPATWHACDEHGKLIGKEAHYSVTGYTTKTCIKTTDGKVHVLLHNEGLKTEEQPFQAMQEYHNQSKRHIGLHCHSVTYWLEDKPYFIILKEFKENKAVVKNCPLFFAGSVKEVRSLSSEKILEALNSYRNLLQGSTSRTDCYTVGALEAFNFYQKIIQDSTPQTGSDIVANYVLQEAIFADITSLFFQMHPEDSFGLSIFEARLIIPPMLPRLKKLLKQIKKHIDSSDLQQALELFTQYRLLLQQCLVNMQEAKEETVSTLKKIEGNYDVEIDFTVAQNEWDKVKTPDNIEFDLGSRKSLSPELQAYVDQVILLLPLQTG